MRASAILGDDKHKRQLISSGIPRFASMQAIDAKARPRSLLSPHVHQSKTMELSLPLSCGDHTNAALKPVAPLVINASNFFTMAVTYNEMRSQCFSLLILKYHRKPNQFKQKLAFNIH